MTAYKMPFRYLLPPSAFLLALCAAPAWAGLPQPSIFHYGQVLDGSRLLENGLIEFVYTPQDGGTPVMARDVLRRIDGPDGEVYSYSLQIPIETSTPPIADSPTAITLGTRSRFYVRTVRVNGEPIDIDVSTLGTSVALNSNDHVGLIERIDLGRPESNCCPGDANDDGFVNLDDYRPVRENFGRVRPRLGDANCDGFVNIDDYRSVRDNFGRECGAKLSVSGSEFALLETRPNDMVLAENAAGFARFHLATCAPKLVVGESLDVDVFMDADGEGAAFVGVFIQFDSARFTFAGGHVDRAALDSETFTGEPRLVADGVVAFPGGASGTMTGGTHLGTLSFLAIGEGEGAFRFAGSGAAATKAQTADFADFSTVLTGTSVLVNPATAVDADLWRHDD